MTDADPVNDVDVYATGRPCAGETQSGDLAYVQRLPRRPSMFLGIIDVLGHGIEAYGDAGRAHDLLEVDAGPDPAVVLGALHTHLRGTRGAAAGIAVIDTETGALSYAGIGNTVLRVLRRSGADHRLVSRDGVVGAQMRTPRIERVDVAPDDVVLLYTDGIRDRFGVDEYPQLFAQDARTIARTILRRFSRDYDDAACIAFRLRRPDQLGLYEGLQSGMYQRPPRR